MKIDVLILRNKTQHKYNPMVDAIIAECIKNKWTISGNLIEITIRNLITVDVIINGINISLSSLDFNFKVTITNNEESLVFTS